MSGTAKQADFGILVVRLGAMGDVIHALPAAALLKRSQPGARLAWAIESRWAPLLEGNPFVDRVLPVDRKSPARLLRSIRRLREYRCDVAVDLQGLIKSALTASVPGPERIFGFDAGEVRERPAALFYSNRISSASAHVVERCLDLAAAAAGCPVEREAPREFPLPQGSPEGELPPDGFVLASPAAGWVSKQWPLDYYGVLAARLHREFGVPLVLEGAPGACFPAMDGTVSHCSGLPGLIDATRRAAAVVGVDSGPLHLAAAVGTPGVAIFGPTSPERNGPCGGSIRVLRHPGANTTYKRGDEIDESMKKIGPDEVFEALRPVLREQFHPAGYLAQ